MIENKKIDVAEMENLKYLNANLIRLNNNLINLLEKTYLENSSLKNEIKDLFFSIDKKQAIEKEKIKNDIKNKIVEKLHEAEMHGNYEPEVTVEMYEEILREIFGD